MKCPQCQFNTRKGEKFCGRCGTRLSIVCPSCRHENPPDYKFCAECGLNFSTGKKPSPLPWKSKITQLKRGEAQPPPSPPGVTSEPHVEKKPPREASIPSAGIPDEVASATADQTQQAFSRETVAESLDEKSTVDAEEVMEPEDVSQEEKERVGMRGLSPWNKFDLVIIAFLALVLMTLCYADARSLLGKTFPGFLLLENRAVSGGLRSDMKPLDIVFAVEGKEVKSANEIMQFIRKVPVGMVLNYTVLRKGELINVPVQSRLYRPHGFFWTIGMNFAVGIGYLLIGMITFVRQSSQKYRWVFFLLCLTVFTLRITTFDFYSSHHFTELFLLSWLLLAAINFHFGLSYPAEKAIVRNRRWLIPLFYFLSIILFMILIPLFYSPTEGTAIYVSALMGYEALALVVLLVSLAHSALRASSPINRMKAKVVFLGFCGSLIPIFSLLISYVFRVNLGVFIVMSWAFSLLFPLTLGYAMIRHRLFGEGSEAPTEGTYKCSSCGNEIQLKRSQKIPVCPACGAGGSSLLWYRVVWTILGV